MSVEMYTLTYDGRPVFTPCDIAAMPASDAPAGDYAPAAPYVSVWRLGDAEHVWCEAYRVPKGQGGVLVLRDFDEALLAVQTGSHLAFAEGVGHFARLVTYGRYGADIFEHIDEDDDD